MDAKRLGGALPLHLWSLCLALIFGAGALPATAQQASLIDWAERKKEELRGQPGGTGSADEHRRFNEPALI